jgi:hypothetical protein
MSSTQTAVEGVAVDIGGMPILLRSTDASFRCLLQDRYSGFVNASSEPQFEFEVELVERLDGLQAEEEVQVRKEGQSWILTRGDFRAKWDVVAGRGKIRQANNPYAVDSVLRIMHTLILSRQGGFLLHAASAIRSGNAFMFAGISGAGKTTISRLAPADVTLLTDEISYVRRDGDHYLACGTPFAGELARVGANQSAPLRALYFLEKGRENRISAVSRGDALRLLLRNILFFAEDKELVNLVFQSACEFVERVQVCRLAFVPDQRVWQMIGQAHLVEA